MAPSKSRHPKKSARYYRAHAAARKHKNLMQRKYNRAPAARKKIYELKKARRQDGNEGKGGKDYSHTACGKLVREAATKNRARQGAGKNRRLKKC